MKAFLAHTFGALNLLSMFRATPRLQESESNAMMFVTDLVVTFCSLNDLSTTCALDPLEWYRHEKDLLLHTGLQSA